MRTATRFFIAVCVSLLLTACERAPTLPRLDPHDVIVAFGLPGVLAEYKPRLVLLCLGGNDMLRRLPEADTENNLRLLVRTIRASGAAVVLIGVPEPRLFGGAPDFYAQLAEEMKLPLEQDAFVEVLKDNRLKSDPVHANAAGYRVVAERLADFLHKAGAL